MYNLIRYLLIFHIVAPSLTRMIPVGNQRMVNATISATTHLKIIISAMKKVKMKVNVNPFIDLLMLRQNHNLIQETLLC
jgi:hypothetical protein